MAAVLGELGGLRDELLLRVGFLLCATSVVLGIVGVVR